MNFTWNLKELFEDKQECLATFQRLDEKVRDLEEFKGQKLDESNIKQVLDSYFACLEESYECLVYGSLRYYDNKDDEAMLSLKSQVEKKNAEIESKLSFIKNMIIKKGKDEITRLIDSNPSLEIYRHFIDDLFRRQEHLSNSSAVGELSQSIIDLNNRYIKLNKAISFDPIIVDGEEVKIDHTNIPKFLLSQDPETRKKTYLSLNRAYGYHEKEYAEVLNEIVKKRIASAKLEGYDSVLSKSLSDENIDPKILDELLALVHQNKHLLQEYMSIQAKFHGIQNPHMYDLGRPLDDGFAKKFPLGESIEIIKQVFKPLGKEYTDIALSLIERSHIDAVPRDEKHQSIIFSWRSFSFLNYRGKYGDLKNLIHELGHSINDQLSLTLPFPYRVSSVFCGETASIVNEILLVKYLLRESNSNEERMFYLCKEIDNYIASIFRQMIYTEFELEIYKKAANGEDLTPEFLGDTYARIVKSYYGDDITYDDELRYEWIRINRIFRWSFYNYKYATGLLMASTVYSNISSGKLTIEEYLEFLSSGSKEYSLDLLKKIHIDPKDPSTLESGFDILKEDLRELGSLVSSKDMVVQPK